MSSDEAKARSLQIPLILIEAARLDGCLHALVADQCATFRGDELDESKRADIRAAREVIAC